MLPNYLQWWLDHVKRNCNLESQQSHGLHALHKCLQRQKLDLQLRLKVRKSFQNFFFFGDKHKEPGKIMAGKKTHIENPVGRKLTIVMGK